jgi:alcohol dehydrogenase (cytochrome c)
MPARSSRAQRHLTAVAALVVALAGATCIDGAAERTAAIAAAPPFTTSELAQPAATNWPTNGGSTTNDRYSTLGQIDTANVHALKGVTLTHVRDSGVGPLFSGESQPVVYDGVIYVSTGADDVFAVSAVTGKILWQYRAHLDPKISTVCCGWLNRGVAVGGGRVYIGQLNGKVVALTQATGKVAWSRQLVRWQDGQTITGAPLYLAGRLYVGVVGGNFGARGLLQAFDALTGAEVWRFYSVPGPGQPGHDTWPQGSSAYLRGGGGIWSTPAVDPALGLIYVTTGNPGDDWFGGLRPGKDLYTSSVVALDLATGKVKWYFQEVHHDIWDYDSASPPILFDVTLHGRTVQASAPRARRAGSTCWTARRASRSTASSSDRCRRTPRRRLGRPSPSR